MKKYNNKLEVIDEQFSKIITLIIFHRWCEMVIKHSWTSRREFVRQFLAEHQSMGIYLYGELAISRSKHFNQLGRQVFEELQYEMDSSTVTNVKELLGL